MDTALFFSNLNNINALTKILMIPNKSIKKLRKNIMSSIVGCIVARE